MAGAIPVIDVSPLVEKLGDSDVEGDADVIAVVKQLDEACRRIGFFYVVEGHGVSTDLMQRVLDVSRAFFDLPDGEKYKIKLSSSTFYRGYQKLRENFTKGQADFQEAVDFFKEVMPNLWPNQPASFRPVMEEYLTKLQELGRRIMQGIALALGGPQDAFEGERGGDPFWVLRVIGYPPAHKPVEMGCGDHTDYGLLTLINQDSDVSALQVQTQGGEWVWAHPIPGTFVVNIGDMLKHRVLTATTTYRVSVPFFYEPNFDARVEPLDFCVGEEGKDPSLVPVVYGDHFTHKVFTNFGPTSDSKISWSMLQQQSIQAVTGFGYEM